MSFMPVEGDFPFTPVSSHQVADFGATDFSGVDVDYDYDATDFERAQWKGPAGPLHLTNETLKKQLRNGEFTMKEMSAMADKANIACPAKCKAKKADMISFLLRNLPFARPAQKRGPKPGRKSATKGKHYEGETIVNKAGMKMVWSEKGKKPGFRLVKGWNKGMSASKLNALKAKMSKPRKFRV